MEYFKMRNILYHLVVYFSNEKLSSSERAKILNEKVSMIDVLDLEDEFLNDTYFALKHFDEELCKPTNLELVYLKQCFENTRYYSRAERDIFINKNN